MPLKEPTTLDEFSGYCASACDGATEEVASLAMAEDPEGLLVGAIMVQDAPETLSAMMQDLLVGRRFAGMATRVNWSPDESPTLLSWLFVAVSAEDTAQFYVKRINVDQQWWRLDVKEAPWFALSTASSLRRKLQGDPEPMTVRLGGDHRLMTKPSDGTPPPLHPDGKI